ncbi:hypothetical protein FR932_07420 [Moritella marina ATCC 15381]|uniref:MaoC-like domain-containing protein n=1 Tax=Moritella marina ATCC 15381 TaxID=1202962 RepID=A0A5J6WHS2_MORMI|nr:hypothetical protein FR932_07420 [Moritella marina ATCC 15381]
MHANQITLLTKQPIISLLYVKAVVNTIVKTLMNTWSTQVCTEQFSISGQKIDQRNLKQYIKCCGFNNTNYVPVTYPFVMIFPLLMKLMTSTQFPISILGLVHYRNRITQHQPIALNAILTSTCRVIKEYITDTGRFIDTHIDVFVDGQFAWECTSTFLQKTKQRKTCQRSQRSSGEKIVNTPANYAYEPISLFKFSPFDVYKYAYISKDTNPIHLHFIPAKLMGFKTAIAHGMFAKARVLAQLENLIDIQHISIDVQFKNAIFLPSQVCLNVALSQQNNTFSLTKLNQRVTHLFGVITPLLDKKN